MLAHDEGVPVARAPHVAPLEGQQGELLGGVVDEGALGMALDEGLELRRACRRVGLGARQGRLVARALRVAGPAAAGPRARRGQA